MGITLLLLAALAAIVLIVGLGWGLFFVLVQLGVIAQKAMEPPTQDSGDYSLDQGRDVGKPE
jgi:hypothetical protein